MPMYKTKLNSKIILSGKVISFVEALSDGSMTQLQFHNKKAYSKRVDNLLTLIELTIAWEIFQSNTKEVNNVR